MHLDLFFQLLIQIVFPIFRFWSLFLYSTSDKHGEIHWIQQRFYIQACASTMIGSLLRLCIADNISSHLLVFCNAELLFGFDYVNHMVRNILPFIYTGLPYQYPYIYIFAWNQPKLSRHPAILQFRWIAWFQRLSGRYYHCRFLFASR